MPVPILTTLWWRRFLRRNAAPWQEADQFAALPEDARRRALGERLLAQLHYFGRRDDALPEWREAARLSSADDVWRVWPTLPVVTKDMLKTRFLAHEMPARFGLEGIVDSTGGSTGEPTRFFLDWPVIRARVAQRIYSQIKMGWRPGMPITAVWGSERDIGKSVSWRDRLAHYVAAERIIDGFRFSDDTTAQLLAEIDRHREMAIYGYSSLLERVARQVVKSGTKPPAGRVKAAWNGGEVLLPEQAEIFRQAFGTPLLNHYGGRELSSIACQHAAGGPLQVLRPWIFLEVVDKAGQPVGPGESGRILCTSTVGRGTPFLRYDIEDIGVVAPGAMDDSGISGLQDVQGRVAGVITLPNGQEINNIYWNHLFKEYADIEQFQIAVRPNGIDLRLRGTRLSADRERELRKRLAIRLGAVPVTINWVDAIPLTRQGKLVQVVREVA
jgi:phenylacetate-CoA ligase